MSDDLEDRARERLGNVLGEKWTLETLVGVGGMAAVYAARHRNGARAAVKILHPELARHEEVRERFRREGYAANRVEHPGAVKVLDDDVVPSGPDAGAAYIVMELLDGVSLQDRLERGPPVSERDFLVIASAVLDVLEAAHARGVVHRDIKPENLFLLREERVSERGVRIKVLDFGLARLLEAQSITTHGLALGTPSFMSPEQAAGRTNEIDGRTDLFSLAATGFRLITGARIHEGAGPVELVTKMAQLPAPPIRDVRPQVSPPFARVIDRALSFRREDRYASAALMRADVEKAIAEIDEAAKAPDLGRRAFEPTQLATASVPPPLPVRVQRRSILPVVAVLAVLAAAALFTFDPSARERLSSLTAPREFASPSAVADALPDATVDTSADAETDVASQDDDAFQDDAAIGDDSAIDAGAPALRPPDASPAASAKPVQRPPKKPNARPGPHKHRKH